MDNELQDEQVKEVEQTEVINPISELEEIKDKYLRLLSDFDNYRKRTLKEKQDLLKYSSEVVLKDLLDVVDDFDLALKNIENTTDINSLKNGIILISNKFNGFLKSKGVIRINDIGYDFNTDFHDAVTKVPVDNDEQKGKIVDIVKTGYLIHDKVIRHSKVIIGE